MSTSDAGSARGRAVAPRSGGERVSRSRAAGPRAKTSPQTGARQVPQETPPVMEPGVDDVAQANNGSRLGRAGIGGVAAGRKATRSAGGAAKSAAGAARSGAGRAAGAGIGAARGLGNALGDRGFSTDAASGPSVAGVTVKVPFASAALHLPGPGAVASLGPVRVTLPTGALYYGGLAALVVGGALELPVAASAAIVGAVIGRRWLRHPAPQISVFDAERDGGPAANAKGPASPA